MKSLELLEDLNKKLIDAEKRADIVYKDVGEYDKLRCDFEHGILNDYYNLTAKQKREKTDELYNILTERHDRKYEYRELEILKELYSLQGIKLALNNAISKLRKLNQEMETPLYYKRAKKNKGKVVEVRKGENN